jgi:hypothetical protein
MTISAKIIADSINEAGNRITTYELEYPRFIHAEFMTHRLFSRNAASSRAIPVERAIQLIEQNTAMPIHWGKNQPGMSAKEECTEPVIIDRDGGTAKDAWNYARYLAVNVAKAFSAAGYHKQIVNRLLEPYSHIKVVCTATEFDNFFYLRRHPDAQPEIQELANQMWLARINNLPVYLEANDWHVPYYDKGFWISAGAALEEESDQFGVTLADAIAISASCCAQVSYRRLDDSLEKAREIYKRLIESKPAHASPFEHQATPVVFSLDDRGLYIKEWYEGVTHMDRWGDAWSGNFRNWIQNRQTIDDTTCWNYNP